MFIRTERLFLRPAWLEDLDELLEVLGDDPATRSVGVSAVPHTAAEMRALLARERDIHLPQLVINLRGDDGAKLIGGIGLGRCGKDVELGYWIARRHRGSGYAAEAVRALLAQARMLGYHQVVATDFAENEGSARVLEQSGFKPIGELRPRLSPGRGGEAPANLYVAVLQGKLFNAIGKGPQPMHA